MSGGGGEEMILSAGGINASDGDVADEDDAE